MSTFSRMMLPEMRYPLPMRAPVRARMSPRSACLFVMASPERPPSPTARIRLPDTDSTMPMMSSFGCFSFKMIQEKMPTNMGFVVTSATELATDVSFSDVIQLEK